MNIEIKKDQTFIDELESRIEQAGEFCSWDIFNMSYHSSKATLTSEFKGLTAPKHLPHMEFLPHQLDCAQQVVEEMNGRGILADEVGLGKTIEAGLVLKEYMIRGLVKKALILVPASLVNQWVTELNQKFYIPAASQRKKYAWEQYDIIVTSIDTAKRPQHREIIQEINYDFILIDEAHKLKNSKTKNYEFVRSLKKKYCLLLTATPVQNRLSDIFNLVSILKPGHLGNYEDFTNRFGRDRKRLFNDDYLKQLIQKVMVRNRRGDTGVDWTKRHVETVWVDFSDEEQQAYDQLTTITRNAEKGSSFSAITLTRELCSSREACYLSIQKMINKGLIGAQQEEYESLIQQIGQLPHHAKAQKMVQLIQQKPNQKFIVFTEYRASQLYLQWLLQQHGISSVPFRGGFKRSKKDWMRQLFQNHAQVLIATEAGGEGINLQFCNNMINYDLPWNPMRLEQRIGRIHRFGQQEDVHIYNLAIRNTMEEHVLTLLYEKIQLFEKVVGNLDSILAELNIKDMEKEMNRIFSESETDGEAKIKLDNLSSVISFTQERLIEEELNGTRESS
ncbi:DEAD/DEAH box helicase [Aquibacillus sp. 3ASR75-11]|uniref:DEAD/DEAH box helicase n=1 Tax=Terrihalobacillus insolitus TaxID=2950438 RepID=A0A9X3WS42_9BACI|nr:SNF2-related protein [Terrihalobacillus insolitus]MDC3413409.1 DEAD/DEAH box helicase [Terrihalobacillus insolitus]MDC3424992.1 DEAD/DEAH box helicase [Terrihalobacillus insolitus]